MRPHAKSELFDRVVPHVLDRLPDEDKASLAATRWSTLEAVLRGCRAVLRVHPNDPVLQVLARQIEDGPCMGDVELRGVRVPGTGARALLEATQRLSQGVPRSRDDTDTHNCKWIDLVWALASKVKDCEARVRGLCIPFSSDRSRTTEALAVQQLLKMPAVREHLRYLDATFWSSEGCSELMLDAIGGLAALQHVCVHEAPRGWTCLMGQYRCLTTLELGQTYLDAQQKRALLDGLEQARHLRRLRLVNCDVAEDEPVRAPPASLEVLEMVDSASPYDLREATNLHALELWSDDDVYDDDDDDDDLGVVEGEWENVAALMLRSNKLQRVTLKGNFKAGDVCAVFRAMERSTVEVFSCNWSLTSLNVGPGTQASLTEALMSGLQNNTTLRELVLTQEREDYCNIFLDVPKLSAALEGNATLRRLSLYSDEIADGDVEAIGNVLGDMQSLEELDLASGKTIAAAGFRLAEGSHLRVLRLRRVSRLDDGSMKHLMSGIGRRFREKSTQLHTLEISGSAITDEGAKHVAAALKNDRCTLRTLVLTKSCIGDEGAAAIADALRHNRFLVSLNLSGNRLTDRGRESLAAALVDNTTLRHLDVSTRGGSALAQQLLHAQRYAMGQRQVNLCGSP